MIVLLRPLACLTLIVASLSVALAQSARTDKLDMELEDLQVNSLDSLIIINRTEYMSLVPEGSDEWFDALYNIVYSSCMGKNVDVESAKLIIDKADAALAAMSAPSAFASGMTAISKATLGMTLRDYQNAVNSTVSAYQYAQQFPAGKEIQKAGIFADFASILQAVGQYKESLQLFDVAETIMLPLGTKRSVIGMAGICCNRGVSYRVLGNIPAAIDNYKKSEALFESVGASTNTFLPVLYTNYMTAYKEAGDPLMTQYYANKSISLAKKLYGRDSFNYASILIASVGQDESNLDMIMSNSLEGMEILEKLGLTSNNSYYTALANVGVAYTKKGKYKEASVIHRREVDAMSSDPMADPYKYASAIMYLGMDLYALGQVDEARDCFRKTSSILKDKYGAKSDIYVHSLINMASIAETTEAGLEMLEEVAGEVIQDSGKENRQYMIILRNKGQYLAEGGNYSAAAETLEEAAALADRLKMYNEKANILGNLGQCYLRLGDIDRYGKVNQEAKEILDKTGLYDYNYYVIVSSLVDYYGVKGEKTLLEKEMRDLVSGIRNAAKDNLSYMTEAEREVFWDKFSVPLKITYKNALALPDVVYDAALISKGLLLSSSIELEKIASESGDPDVSADIAALRQIRASLASSPSDSLRLEAKAIEERLAIASKEYGKLLSSLSHDWKDVQASLGKGDIAVEFLSFDDSHSPVYACLGIMKGWDKPKVMFVNSDPNDVYAAAIESDIPEVFEMTEWYQAMWREVTKHVSKNANIFFAPDGVLHKAPMEYFPIDSKGRRMCDVYRMHRLSSTRELVSGENTSSLTSAVVFGGLDYDLSGEDMEMHGESLVRSSADNGEWAYLPGTLTEAKNIAATLSGAGLEVKLITGEDGVESSFKTLSGNAPSIIHIATHGVHQPEPGLVFAGVNSGYVSGILSAKEISLSDLRNTSLVVLSACSTGLGKASHEGVYGLQRAFKKAGAKSIVMSLWDVDDSVTAYMMDSFYEKLAQGKTPENAFTEALSSVRDKYPDFTKWAAFVLLR